MRAVWISVLLVVSTIWLSSCGRDTGSQKDISTDSNAPQGHSSPIGLWERRIHADIGPRPLVVLEIKDDGTYVRHGTNALSDRGRYAIQGRIISFRSDLENQNAVDTEFSIVGESMTIKYTLLFPV
ncbi:MAG: hypothetical protein AAGC77_10525, partial [Pseudomonadota bacterium]